MQLCALKQKILDRIGVDCLDKWIIELIVFKLAQELEQDDSRACPEVITEKLRVGRET